MPLVLNFEWPLPHFVVVLFAEVPQVFAIFVEPVFPRAEPNALSCWFSAVGLLAVERVCSPLAGFVFHVSPFVGYR